jgi:hypothetical protein
MANDILSGKWIYRSFYNDRHELVRAAATPDEQASRALTLLWGEGVAIFETPSADGKVTGKLVFRPAATATGATPASPEIALALVGQAQFDATGTPVTIELQGVGPTVDPRQPWKYSIKGWFVQPWAISPSQRPSFVGSVVNTVRIEGPPPAGAELGTVGTFALVSMP